MKETKMIIDNQEQMIRVCDIDNIHDILQDRVNMIMNEIFRRTYKIKKVSIECDVKTHEHHIEKYYFFKCRTLHQDVIIRLEELLK